ncbi:ferredoxin [Flexivirga oryzae]|uniref:Ferredoxin n=1 Tax=Flexivirga oryzae TaxID=1794944 RepID=A0A839N2H3_9MICO|nr:ferredoxin [Flexivirga oryzae]MBB2890294.1 ferredoxin [Flexivirga oryzae]
MRAEREHPAVVRVDRIACSAHGACRAIAPEHLALDEWGYPIPSVVVTDGETAAALVRFCPAAALRRTTPD